jgi:microcystin-dependent protein
MSEPFLAEIKIVSFNFPPKGWTLCNGQLLPINQNQALFSLLGTTYGGDGRTTFGLPNLQGRIPTHDGNGLVLGERGGETSHTLNISELPAHNHVPWARLPVPPWAVLPEPYGPRAMPRSFRRPPIAP